MSKLSQRAWNNVIIVSMLMLIMLFNFSSHLLNNEEDDAPLLLTLVAPNKTITTIAFEQIKVERIVKAGEQLLNTLESIVMKSL